MSIKMYSTYKNTFAPIALFVHNRPNHLKQTIGALIKNYLIEDSELFIFSDSPKSEKDEILVNEVRKFIKEFRGFKKIYLFEREINFGLSKSIISGVTEVIEKFGKAIVLEDNIVTSPYFLKFMNEALEFYNDDKRIYSISGYNFPIKIPKEYYHKIYISPRPSSWGWSTWQDRWRKVEWKPENIFDVYNKNSLRNLMNKAGKDLATMLLKSIEGKISSWAVKWAFTHLINESYCLYPIKSLVKNIGADATGTNFKNKVTKFNVDIDNSFFIQSLTSELIFLSEIQIRINSIVDPSLLRRILNHFT